MGAQERGTLSPAPPYLQGISASAPPFLPGKNILRADGWEAHGSYVKAINNQQFLALRGEEISCLCLLENLQKYGSGQPYIALWTDAHTPFV